MYLVEGHQIFTLSALDYSVVAPDFRGYGDTDAPTSPSATPASTWLETSWQSWTPSHLIRSRCLWCPMTGAPSSLGTSACSGPTGSKPWSA
ncbi:hypothetical protein ACFX1X_023618 [Malus domestica]